MGETVLPCGKEGPSVTGTELKKWIGKLPPPPQLASASGEPEVKASLLYLASEDSAKSLALNCYWPKWDSPWWHMALLYEMGLAHRIPKSSLEWMLLSVKQMLPVFFRADLPPGRDPALDTPCPCSLGNIYQILSAAGAEVDTALPWARSWFLRYQMPDGGLNCDEDAYHAEPKASSVVGTIAPLEALLDFTPRPFTPSEANFLDRGANCLIERELRFGCQAPHNLEEREDEEDWQKLCFPRYYHYDILRGLHFLLKWADRRKKRLAVTSIQNVVESLLEKSQDGILRTERSSYQDIGTRFPTANGNWIRREAATTFPLLLKVSQIGQPSSPLTAQWYACRQLMARLIQEGLLA